MAKILIIEANQANMKLTSALLRNAVAMIDTFLIKGGTQAIGADKSVHFSQ